MPKSNAKQVVLDIIRAADGELSGKTRLFKAFYFAHLAYFQSNPGLLTDWPIARMPNGPGIDRSETLFASLVDFVRGQESRRETDSLLSFAFARP